MSRESWILWSYLWVWGMEGVVMGDWWMMNMNVDDKHRQ